MIFQMADQTVWQFDREEIYVRKKKMIQVTASERTMLYQLLKRQEEGAELLFTEKILSSKTDSALAVFAITL